MARNEQNREDILREATALVERAEFTVGGCEENVVIGFRAGGAASVFLGADPVYQFNTAGELRRAYRDGLLIKAENGKLVELTRRRAAGQVQLLRRELDENETAKFLAAARSRLAQLQQRLEAGDYKIIGQVPAEINVVTHIGQWLSRLSEVLSVAAKANVS